jgi:hypothetical protein
VVADGVTRICSAPLRLLSCNSFERDRNVNEAPCLKNNNIDYLFFVCLAPIEWTFQLKVDRHISMSSKIATTAVWASGNAVQ